MSAPTATAAVTCPNCGEARLPGARFCTNCGNTFAAPSLPPASGQRQPRLRRLARRVNLRGDGSDLLYVIVAAILAVGLSHIPVVNVLIYPFKLFGTFVHEWSHALVAIATGGRVLELQINADLSGETMTSGGWLLPIFSAGYTGAAIVGALLLLTPTRFANRLLVGIGVVSILMPLFGTLAFGTSFPSSTWIWTVVFGSVTLLVGARATPRIAKLFQQFVAVELCFTALDSLRNLAWLSMNEASVRTDATNASGYTHLPALFWSIVWGVIAVVAIALSATRVVRRSLV